MYLGRQIDSFRAEDSGIVAAGLKSRAAVAQPEPELILAEAPLELTAPAVAVAEEGESELADGERQRLWSLVGTLRKANARLFKANRRLTKEAEALRAERVPEGTVTVASILEAAESSSVRS